MHESPTLFEKPPLLKEDVVKYLAANGPKSAEALEMLDRFTSEREEHFLSEGRQGARLESLREKAHALSLASCFAEAVFVMQDVLEIAHYQGDEESYNEALWIIDRLEAKLERS